MRLIDKAVVVAAMLLATVGAVGMLKAAPAAQNSITIVVSDGPFTGSYTTEPSACPHLKERNTLGCGWKGFAHNVKTKQLEEAGIQVDTVSAGPGARTGDIVVKFLDGISENLHDYSLNNVPMTLTRDGVVQTLVFDGKAKDGTHIRVTGTIVQVDEF